MFELQYVGAVVNRNIHAFYVSKVGIPTFSARSRRAVMRTALLGTRIPPRIGERNPGKKAIKKCSFGYLAGRAKLVSEKGTVRN